jgi:small neutral amino acid transporter SnatA (MarC family)
MNLTDSQRRMIVLGIALLFILVGVAQGLFKININKDIVEHGSFILMFTAFVLLFSGKKPKKEEEEEKKQDEKGEIDS